MRARFSLARVVAIMLKEFVQMRRDRLTFAMIVGIPILQLVLFGYAINSDPKSLPTAVVDYDTSDVHAQHRPRRSRTRGYFAVVASAGRRIRRRRACSHAATCSSRSSIPPDFSRKLERGERPSVLVAADATDPAATGNALAALNAACRDARCARPHRATGARSRRTRRRSTSVVQRRYNPEGITQYNIVPGLLGVILQMTMVMMTAFAITRERERGTFENLLATPAQPLEVMTGKIAPYIVVGLRAGRRSSSPRRGSCSTCR